MDHSNSTFVKPSKILIFWEAFLKCNNIVENALKNDFVSDCCHHCLKFILVFIIFYFSYLLLELLENCMV